MANIKSAKKRVLVTQTKTAMNRSRKTEVKGLIKKFELALEAGNTEEAKALLKQVESTIDKAASKGTFKKQTASRKVGRLHRRLNTLQ